jgi:CheY-like chemotaxis protein
VREHIQEERVDPESDVEQLSLIERNAQRLLRLVDQILGIARMEAGTYELDARPTDLGADVERIARTFEPLAEREQLELTVRTGDRRTDAPPVYVDRETLEYIVGNLLSNAVKFTPEGGRITVTVTETDQAVEVAVADTGSGIPADQQEVIFDRFEQVDDTSTRPQEGVGIGLAFASDLVDLHGGSIDLESAEGEGTTVTVRFRRGTAPLSEDQLAAPDDSEGHTPAEGPERPPAPLPADAEPSPDGPAPEDSSSQPVSDGSPEPRSPKQVLVVDDNADVRQYVRQVLTPEFSVLEAADGTEGAEKAREHLPDVILADVMMPSVDGYEMTRRLKDHPETAAIPVIMVTARASAEEEVEGLQVGADDYVTKPFDADVLRQRVGGVITLQERLRRRLQQELADEGPPTADEPPPRSDVEREARTVIREHLSDPDFRVDQLAEKMAMGRTSLYRAFEKKTDQTPSELITEVRMETATELLERGVGSVTEVAYAVGYDTLSSFSRAYREYAGQSPSAVDAET